MLPWLAHTRVALVSRILGGDLNRIAWGKFSPQSLFFLINKNRIYTETTYDLNMERDTPN